MTERTLTITITLEPDWKAALRAAAQAAQAVSVSMTFWRPQQQSRHDILEHA